MLSRNFLTSSKTLLLALLLMHFPDECRLVVAFDVGQARCRLRLKARTPILETTRPSNSLGLSHQHFTSLSAVDPRTAVGPFVASAAKTPMSQSLLSLPHSEWTTMSGSSSLLLSDSNNLLRDIPSVILIPSVFLLGAIAAFVYANLVYTPEILENAELIRLEDREEEVMQILTLVQDHLRDGKDLKELRQPLEFGLNMPLEDYVTAVLRNQEQEELAASQQDEVSKQPSKFTNADTRLATLLKSYMKESL